MDKQVFQMKHKRRMIMSVPASVAGTACARRRYCLEWKAEEEQSAELGINASASQSSQAQIADCPASNLNLCLTTFSLSYHAQPPPPYVTRHVQDLQDLLKPAGSSAAIVDHAPAVVAPPPSNRPSILPTPLLTVHRSLTLCSADCFRHLPLKRTRYCDPQTVDLPGLGKPHTDAQD